MEFALVDTSVWIDHLRRRNERLAELLGEGRVTCHEFVIGELACGAFKNRGEILALLGALPASPVAEHEEVVRLVEQRRLAGRGLGWIDMHLLASALLANCPLWTNDRALGAAATELGVAE